ncbi:MAG: TIGR03435 family protein [Acidobacteriia bacterium]|nr:TIGR03435 family protein [Terriglobia bacterium]
MVAQHATMAEFIGTLAGPLRTPVIDKTGLTGRYDFTVDLSSYFADAKPGQQTDMTSIMMSALREQLGLNLESRKEPVEILVIDHAEKNPTGN